MNERLLTGLVVFPLLQVICALAYYPMWLFGRKFFFPGVRRPLRLVLKLHGISFGCALLGFLVMVGLLAMTFDLTDSWRQPRLWFNFVVPWWGVLILSPMLALIGRAGRIHGRIRNRTASTHDEDLPHRNGDSKEDP